MVCSIVFHPRPRKPADLFLCFFKEHALAERRVELRELDFAFNGLLVLARPDDVLGLRGLQPEEAVL